MRKIHYTRKYKRVRVKSPNYFDKRSFRTKDVGRPEHHKIIIGCKKGEYNPKTKRCKVGIDIQAIIKRK